MIRPLLISVGFLSVCCACCLAAPPSAAVLPATTKAYISLPAAKITKANFDKSQLGELTNDPKMKPFMDDFEKQLEDRGRLAERLGVATSDLEFVDEEIAMAVIQPGGDENKYATALIVDVKGHGGEAGNGVKLLQSALKRQVAKGGKVGLFMFGTTNGRAVVMPAKGNAPKFASYYFFFETLLVACDHQTEAENIYARLKAGGGKDSLANLPAFGESIKHVTAASGELKPDMIVFLEPFGYARVSQAEQKHGPNPPKEKRGASELDMYENQGFDGIQGIAGWVNFEVEGYEALFRAFVYAPAVDRSAKDAETLARIKEENRSKEPPLDEPFMKYFLGARMMNFPNRAGLKPVGWIPNELASCIPFNWRTQHAFQYSESLIDELSGEKKFGGMWRDIIDGIRDDDEGPEVDIRKDMVAHMSEDAVMIVDYVVPITPQSERQVTAIRIEGDVATVKKALDDLMKDDPDAELHKVGDVNVWELITRPDEEQLEAKAKKQGKTVEEVLEELEERDSPNSAMAVAHGYFFRSTHADILKRFAVQPPKENVLADRAEFKAVIAELEKLGAKEEAARDFSYTDKMVYPQWELWKAGKMPESEMMLGNLLNQMMGYDPDDDDQPLREQEFDASKLPDFEVARKYLGVSGWYATTEADGWLVHGVLLTKE